MCASYQEFQIIGSNFQIHPEDTAARMVELVLDSVQHFKLFLHMVRNFPEFCPTKDTKRFETEFRFQCNCLDITSVEKIFDLYYSFFIELERSKKKFLEFLVGHSMPCYVTYPREYLERKYEPRILDAYNKRVGNNRKVDIVCYSTDITKIIDFHGEFIECKFNAANFLSFSVLKPGTKEKLEYMHDLCHFFRNSKESYFAIATFLNGSKVEKMLRHHGFHFIHVLDHNWFRKRIEENTLTICSRKSYGERFIK